MSKKDKKKIKGTTWIKWGVLALTLSMPILELGANALYTLNPNAYQSYYGETINNATYTHTNYADLVVGETYQINPINIGTQSGDLGSSVYRININNPKLLNDNTDISAATSFSIFSLASGTSYIHLYDENNNNLIILNSAGNKILQYQLISKNLLGTSITLFDLLNNNLVEYNKYSYLDNMIPYKKQQQLDTGILSWTPTSFTYSAINNMLVGLNMNDQYLSGLLTYWTMITAIYVVFDVVLHFFEWITHMLNKDE